MLLRFIIFLYLVNVSIAFCACPIINEIMPAPGADEPEWVELYNYSDADVCMDGMLIYDAVRQYYLPPVIIPACNYLLLTTDSLALCKARSTGSPILETKLPGMNNDSDFLVIKAPGGEIIDSLFYDMKWGHKEVSLERVLPDQSAISADNLKQCTAPTGATAGALNSVSEAPVDLLPKRAWFSSPDVLYVESENIGTEDCSNAQLRLLFAGDDGSFLNIPAYTCALDITCNSLSRTEINLSDLSAKLAKGQYYTLKAISMAPDDARQYNDTLLMPLYIPPGTLRCLSINEFLFDNSDDFAEFVELYNNSSIAINLRGWSVRDRYKQSGYDSAVVDTDFELSPGGYIALSWDSLALECFTNHESVGRIIICQDNNLNLNKSGDDILLCSPNGIIYDSLTYSASWHSLSGDNTDRSLEKKKTELSSEIRSSWLSCIDDNGFTPGYVNSVISVDASEDLVRPIIYPNPMCLEDRCYLTIRLSENVQYAEVKIVSIMGDTIFERKGFINIISWRPAPELPAGIYFAIIDCANMHSCIPLIMY